MAKTNKIVEDLVAQSIKEKRCVTFLVSDKSELQTLTEAFQKRISWRRMRSGVDSANLIVGNNAVIIHCRTPQTPGWQVELLYVWDYCPKPSFAWDGR